METLGKLTLFILVIIGAFLTSLLATHIVLSIANLYELSFVSGFSFTQIYGVLILLSLVTYRHKDTKVAEETPSNSSVVWGSAKQVLTKLCYLLLSWGMAFLSYSLLT